MYFSGQGPVLVAKATSGVPGVFRDVGNCKGLDFSLQTTTLEHKESGSGSRLTDKRLETAKSATISSIWEEFSEENLVIAGHGASSIIAAGTVTAEVMPLGVVAGDILRLAKPKVSSVVVKDSAGSPVTLTLGTHYEINSANHGSIKILDVAAFTQPFTVDYANAQVTNINLLTQAPQEFWVRFHGLNTAEGNAPVLVELYRVTFDPLDKMDLIADDILGMALKGSVLYDATKAADATLGQFGRVVMI